MPEGQVTDHLPSQRVCALKNMCPKATVTFYFPLACPELLAISFERNTKSTIYAKGKERVSIHMQPRDGLEGKTVLSPTVSPEATASYYYSLKGKRKRSVGIECICGSSPCRSALPRHSYGVSWQTNRADFLAFLETDSFNSLLGTMRLYLSLIASLWSMSRTTDRGHILICSQLTGSGGSRHQK